VTGHQFSSDLKLKI